MEFNNSGGMKSPFSPRVRQSISGRRPLSGKKNQSLLAQPLEKSTGDVIYKTPMTTIETYGPPLPVMVTEILTFASDEVTVRLSESGWCWAVSGRRCVLWSRDGGTVPAARELTLPQTDLKHKADLVSLFYEDDAQMPSCIGVSPEGTIRYWPSIGQEGVYVDISAELAGQECDRLVEGFQGGLLLATTTCTVLLVKPSLIEGRAAVSCRTLRPPSGWLGGLGRRVSLLFFGTMPAHADTKLVGITVLTDGPTDADCCFALVGSAGGAGGAASPGGAGGAGGPVLQVWAGGEVHEHSLHRALTQAGSRQGDLSSLEIAALDVRASGPDSLLLLLATGRASDRYALAHLVLEDNSSLRVSALAALPSWARGPHPRVLPAPRVLLYTARGLQTVSPSSPDSPDYVDVSADGDRILGAELCGAVPLLFSRKHGLLRARETQASVACESPLGSPCSSDMYEGNLSLYEIDPDEILNDAGGDLRVQLQTAFLYHARRSPAKCADVLRAAFPMLQKPATGEGDVDAALDRTVLAVATEMLDDMPTGDPRWQARLGRSRVALGGSAALHPQAHLQDKRRAFSLFLDFLSRAPAPHDSLKDRLQLVSREGADGCISTLAALGALYSRLALAIAIRREQTQSAQLILAALHQVVCAENPDYEEDPEVIAAVTSGALTPADVAYRRVSRASSVLCALCAAGTTGLPAAARILSEVVSARQQWARSMSDAALPPLLEPPLLAALQNMIVHSITVDAHNCTDLSSRASTLDACARLADLVLADQAQGNKPPTRRLVRTLLRPLWEEGMKERAAFLAEKYKNFELLIEMCVTDDDLPRLLEYIDKYVDEGMAEESFSWLAERGGRHVCTLARDVFPRLPPRVSARAHAWLRVPARAPLRALDGLRAARWGDAAAALCELAEEETESAERLQSMASLAKLCLVLDPEPSALGDKVEKALQLCEQQRSLPRDVRIHHGLDDGGDRVYSAEDLALMYITSESPSLTEFDYRKALELTELVSDADTRASLRLQIWCRVILRSDWLRPAGPEDTPTDVLHDTMFFRMIDMIHVMGGDLQLLLPPLEDVLSAPAVSTLLREPRAHYALRHAYECAHASTV